MSNSKAPEKVWAWCFDANEFGGWGEWGGFARPKNRHALDKREEATGAEYIRADLLAPAWQPIETAPKDGTWFVTAKFGDKPEYEIGRYNPLPHRRFVERDDGLFEAVDEQIFDWEGFKNFARQTHWMPLPDPPK